jgi:hypothetical protein
MTCACSGIQSVGNAGTGAFGEYVSNPYLTQPGVAGLGATNPDGLGAEGGGPALFGTVTGHNLLDGALAAALGYFVSPRKEDRAFWAAAGAAAGAMAGTLGFLALIGAAVWIRKER